MRLKLVLLMAAIAITSLNACKKYEIKPNVIGENQTTYNWQGCNPKPVEALGKDFVAGYDGVFDYRFRIHLDGSQVDPNPLIISDFGIPHVGPGGGLIYENVANDATYTIDRIGDGYIYFTIRSESGHTLKYNIAKKVEGEMIWFLRYGLSADDGVSNMVTFVTN